MGKEPIKSSAAVAAAVKAGPYKVTPISPDAVKDLICAKMSDAGSWSALLFDWNGNHFFDEKMKSSCDSWQGSVQNYNDAIINYYKTKIASAAPDGDKNIPSCLSDGDAASGQLLFNPIGTRNIVPKTCLATNSQIESLKNKMDSAFALASAAVTVANADAAVSDAQKALDDSKCQQNPNLVDSTNDNPAADFVTQYKKEHPGQAVPTCQQFRDAVNAATAAQKQAEETAKAAGAGGNACSFTDGDFSACLLGIMASIVAKIVTIILGVVAGILYLANYLLGWSTYVTVFQFGNLIGNSEGLLAAWGVLRDVANILLLFGFIFMGISTILNLSHSEYTAKRALPTLIIFALLLNFSLLAAEAVIDVSNAVATSIYMQAGGDCSQSNLLECATDKGIGGTVMQLSGVGSAFSASWAGGINTATTEVVIVIGLTIFLLITAIVLFAAAIMLIIRAVMLGLLMVTSPIGFAGMAIPPLNGVSKLWWKQLISQATFAPVYFLIAFVSLKMMEGIVKALDTSGKTSEQNLAAVFSSSVVGGGSSNASVGITFALLIGFMVAALMFAKKSSAIGTNYALKSAGGLAFGSLGFVGRNTVGRAAYRTAEGLNKTAFGRTALGTFTANRLGKAGKGSFDFRGGGGGAALAGAAGLGVASKGGYSDAVHARQEAQEKRAKDLKNTQAELDKIDALKGTEIPAAERAITEDEPRHRAELATLQKQLNAQREANGDPANSPELDSDRNQISADKTEFESAQNMSKTLQEKADQARSSGNVEQGTALQAKADKAAKQTEALKAALNDKEASLQKKLDKKLEPILQKITAENDRFSALKQKKVELEAELRVTIQAPKRQFANAIHKPGPLGRSFGLLTGVDNVGDHHAAEAILRELDKSENQKLLDALGNTKASLDGAGHAPAPVTTGGGPTITPGAH